MARWLDDAMAKSGGGQVPHPPAVSAIERYFEVSLYLLIVTGFATLAGTGKLDPLSLLVVSMALLYRGYLLLRGRTLLLSERATSLLTIAYVLFYVADLFFVSANFVTATVHLVLFAMVVKIFSVQRDRDHLYLAIISFLSVLAAAVLTVDTIFLILFCGFLLLAVATFISMEMRRSAARAVNRAREPRERARSLGASLSTTALALMLATAAGASLLFFILPRLSAGYLSAYAPRNNLATGFSEQVQLGAIGEIQQSSAVVMHVQVEGDSSGAYQLKWRGVALDNFDGKRWTSAPSYRLLSAAPGLGFNLPAGAGELAVVSRPRRIAYRVLMEPIGASVFFLAPVARTLSGPYREIAVVDGSGAVINADRERTITVYRATSDITEPSPGYLRQASGEVPPQIARRYLQLPALDRRVPELAFRVTAATANAYDKAAAVEDYLRRNYSYTLQLPKTAPRDPLASFLFERKAGHCEYFASSMAILLRSVGIPARVVNGFRGGEFNPLTGSYIVRARDAHSWVEVYLPGQGWVSFDPTPPAAVPGMTAWNRAALYLDALREFWREWVINYDFAHQTSLASTVTVRSRRSFDRGRLWLRHRYHALLNRARHAQAQVTAAPRRNGMLALGAAALLVLLLNSRRLLRAWRANRLARNPQRAPQAAASLWYARMTRAAARRGFHKRPTHTPQEFVRTIHDARLRGVVAAFTERYERARFGDSAEDARTLPELYEEIAGPAKPNRD